VNEFVFFRILPGSFHQGQGCPGSCFCLCQSRIRLRCPCSLRKQHDFLTFDKSHSYPL
jgi:hypothetical protein